MRNSSGSAQPVWGTEGPKFKSRQPDKQILRLNMKEFCAYWIDEFDWRKQEAAINQVSHYITPIEGIDLHFLHEKGSGPAPPCFTAAEVASAA